VSIVESLKRWRDLSRLRSRARRSPSPSAWGELAERLIAHGQVDAAERAAAEGLRSFPHSERLAQVRLFAKRGRLAGEIRRLREDVARRPTPVAFTRLAALYRDLEQSDEALDVAREGAERFPLSEGPHLVQGEIRVERFLRDRVGRDAILAEQSLQRVLRINPRSGSAGLLLAELCWLVGDVPGCRRHLRVAIDASPVASAVREFARKLDVEAAASAGAAQPGSDEDDAGFAELAMLVEERGAFANAPALFPAPRGAAPAAEEPAAALPESLRDEVDRLGTAPHVRGAIALDREGAVLASRAEDNGTAEGLCEARLAELVAALAASADDATRRLDAGSLVRAEIECPSGSVLVARLRGVTIGLLYSGPLDGEGAWELVQDAAARWASAPREEAARA
jgi:predicted regulator of Ras-like GTPase activity (Roadblock/LC7/MglB family)